MRSLTTAILGITIALFLFPAASASAVSTPSRAIVFSRRIASRPSARLRRASVQASASARSRVSVSSTFSSSSRFSNRSSFTDPLPDNPATSSLLLLGRVSPVLGRVRLFSTLEPLMVETITVSLTAPVSSVESFLVYRNDGMLLGSAFLENGSYVLHLPSRVLTIPKREGVILYVRARVKGAFTGGVSGETVQIASIMAAGHGDWSAAPYTTGSTDYFAPSQTALGMIMGISGNSHQTGPLVSGPAMELGEFQFSAVTVDGTAQIALTDLLFQIESTDGVSVSAVFLQQEGSPQQVPCSIGGSKIICGSLPSDIGRIGTRKVFRLYGDIAVSGSSQRLSISLNEPGSIGNPGAVTWTDGTHVFEWLPLTQPMARGMVRR